MSSKIKKPKRIEMKPKGHHFTEVDVFEINPKQFMPIENNIIKPSEVGNG